MNTENAEISKWSIMQAELENLETVLRYSWPSLSLEANKTTPGSSFGLTCIHLDFEEKQSNPIACIEENYNSFPILFSTLRC